MIHAAYLLNANSRRQTSKKARKPARGWVRKGEKAGKKKKEREGKEQGWDPCLREGAVRDKKLPHPGKPSTGREISPNAGAALAPRREEQQAVNKGQNRKYSAQRAGMVAPATQPRPLKQAGVVSASQTQEQHHGWLHSDTRGCVLRRETRSTTQSHQTRPALLRLCKERARAATRAASSARALRKPPTRVSGGCAHLWHHCEVQRPAAARRLASRL